ncbi:MAG: hypothetical protein ACQEW9_02555 [Bacteroidota bacterium]|uniref:Uncharacterized protein n=1 Tax=Algoriphagus faecimaris TaxID=686796 RepID=A0A1G6NSC3_9BACT|nr:hypothetical protein [Algoriphagus faecimaris]SDC70813.1 hypothetical protein SAMN04488104_100455 [Algoriphagus faecimaris]
MNKLIPIFINGKKWVQLSQLSRDQERKFKSWLPVNCLKKVFFQGMELKDCVDFETYEYWFKSNQISGQKQEAFDI